MNPWRLQTWLGHKRIDEMVLYVHVAEAHALEWPEPVHAAARREIDPDERIVASSEPAVCSDLSGVGRR
jgi:hypothetical protein